MQKTCVKCKSGPIGCGNRSYCCKCCSGLSLTYYRKNRDKLLAEYEKRRKLVQKAKDKPCSDCGNKFHFSAMHFDHVRGEKKFDLSSYGSRKISSISDEIDKCDVVCANCHSVRSFNRQNGENALYGPLA